MSEEMKLRFSGLILEFTIVVILQFNDEKCYYF